MKYFFVVLMTILVSACGGGGGDPSRDNFVPTPVQTPVPTPFHAGMSEVNIGQNSMVVTLGFAGDLILGFLPAEKEVRLVDVASVCVDSNSLGWGDSSTKCIAPDYATGIATVSNTAMNDCVQFHLKLKDGTLVWSDITSVVITGRIATKQAVGDGQCLQYGTMEPSIPVPLEPTPEPTPVPSSFHAGMSEVNIGQNSMVVTLGFAGDLILGFLPAEKEVRLVDVASVCVDSNSLGWGDSSTKCIAPDYATGIATVSNTAMNDCVQFHLKLKDGTIMWSDINMLVMTGRPALPSAGCLQY